MANDGELIFKLGIEKNEFSNRLKQVKAELKDLEKEAKAHERKAEAYANKADNAKYQKDADAFRKQSLSEYAQADSYQAEINAKLNEQIELEKQIANINKEIEQAKADQKSQGASDKAQSQVLNMYQNAIKEYVALQNQMLGAMDKNIDPASNEFAELSQRIEDAFNKCVSLNKALEKLSGSDRTTANNNLFDMQDVAKYEAEKYKTSYVAPKSDEEEAISQAKRIGRQIREAIANATKGLASKVGSMLKQAPKMIKDKLTKPLTQTRQQAETFARAFFSLGRMLKTRFKRMFVSSIFNGLKNGLNSVIQKSTETANAVGMFKNSLNGAYLGLGAMISPLVNALAPALSRIIDMFSQATMAVQRFFAMLTGQSYVLRAVKNQNNYAAALGDTASNAKKANAEQKRALASFDEINQLKLAEDNDSTGGSGNLSSLGTLEKESFKPWEELKNAIENGEWVKVGELIAEKVNEAVAKIQWEDIGRKIGGGFDKAFKIAYGFLKTIDTRQIGDGIARMFNAFSESFEMWFAGASMAELWNSVSNFIAGFALQLDWSGIAQNIAGGFNGFIQNFDVSAFGEGIMALFKGVGEFVGTLISEIDWATLAEKLLSGIGLLFVSLIAGVVELVGTLITAVKEKLGIHSPSTVFNEIGTDLVAGFILGIQTMWKKLISVITGLLNRLANLFGINLSAIIENGKVIFNGLTEFLTGVFTGDWESAWNGVRKIFGGIWNSIVSMLESAVNFIVDALNSLSFDVPDWVPIIGGSHFGFNLSRISIPRIEIPALATGTVVPRNAGMFTALLGDNKNEPEIVSPLSTMKQALLEAMQESGGGQPTNISINFTGDLAELARILKPELDNEDKRVGVRLVEVQ